MATGRGPARRGADERYGSRLGVAAVPRCLRRVVLTSSLADAGAGSAAEILEAHGVSLIRVDTSAEDPFLDVSRLVPDLDLTDAQSVITLGPPSATALAIALLCDLPFTMAGVIDGRRLGAIDAALASGSAMHRSVLDVEIDGVRRLRFHGLGPPRRMRIVVGLAELVPAWCARTRD